MVIELLIFECENNQSHLLCHSNYTYGLKDYMYATKNSRLVEQKSISKTMAKCVSGDYQFELLGISDSHLMCIFKSLYNKKHRFFNRKMGLSDIKYLLSEASRSEFQTLNNINNVSVHNLVVFDFNASKELGQIEKVYEELKELGYQDEIKEIDWNKYPLMSRVSGIYEIVNLQNSKRYIGKSKMVGTRWGSHRATLRNGYHHCRALAKDWIKYGEESFKFNLIEEVDDTDPLNLAYKERYWWENTEGEKYNKPENMLHHTKYKIMELERKVEELERELAKTS